jgi:hypothetical protein
VGAGGDAGRVGGRRGRIGPTLMRHAYLDMFKRYGRTRRKRNSFFLFFSRKKETRPSFYFSRGQRTDGREREKNKNSSGRNQIVTQTDSWPDTAAQISSAASNLGTHLFSFSNMNNNNSRSADLTFVSFSASCCPSTCYWFRKRICRPTSPQPARGETNLKDAGGN